AGLTGWRVYLDLNNDGGFQAGEPNRVTDADGFYQFKGFSPGTGTLPIVLQSGWTATAPGLGYYSGTMTSGQVNKQVNFGMVQGATPPITAFFVTDQSVRHIQSLLGDSYDDLAPNMDSDAA